MMAASRKARTSAFCHLLMAALYIMAQGAQTQEEHGSHHDQSS